MANQAIALQARAPQTDILGGAIRNNAQMINMMAQQQAAQRQNAIAEQTMQIQRAKEGREAAMAAPQLAEAQSRAGSARQDFVVKAVGHALHTSVNNPTDETLDQAARMLAGIGLDPAEIEREITPIKQLPLDQRKGALMQSILSDPNSKAAFEATLPKPKEMRLGDRTILIDENPLSSTFNQPIRTEMVGMTPAQAYNAEHPTLQHIQGADNGVYSFNTKTGGAAPVMVGGGGGGGIPGARGGGDFGTFKSAVVQTESHGDYTALSPKGALGAYQVMPATAKTLAGRLGLPWNPELMRSNTPEGRQYQDAIGDAAAQEAWQAGNGDPARAAAYYHGGSDESQWKGKTQAYARNVVANMGRAPAAAPAAGGGQLQGPTKGKPAATAAASSSPAIQDIDAQISRLDELYNHKGLENITGSVHGRMGSLNALPGFDVGGYRIGGGGQEADNAQALLETIQANATLGELQKLKQSGTTLGQIAVYEDKMLGKAAANLKQTQDKATFQKALREYKARLLEVKKLLVRASIPETAVKHLRDNPSLKNAFDSKYGAGMAASVLGGR